MNTELSNFAREKLKEQLALLPESNQMIFKRMYSHEDLNKNIDDVVDDMDDSQLDWAMKQVYASILKMKGKKEGTK